MIRPSFRLTFISREFQTRVKETLEIADLSGSRLQIDEFSIWLYPGLAESQSLFSNTSDLDSSQATSCGGAREQT